MSWIKDTWDEITSGGEAVTETYNGSGSSSGSSGGRNLDADNFAGSNYVATANTGNDDSGTNSDGVGVKFDNGGTAGYIHTAASYGDYNDGNNYIPDDELSFYLTEEQYKKYQEDPTSVDLNSPSTITAEQYKRGKAMSRILTSLAGPIGLGMRAIIEMQKRGLLPGVSAESYLENRGIQDQTQTGNDDIINNLIDSGASNEEIEDAIDSMVAEGEIGGITAAVGAMSDAAFENSSVDTDNSELFSDTALSDKVGSIDTTNTNIDETKYEMGEGATADLSQVEGTETVDAPDSKGPADYTAETVSDKIGTPETTVDAVTGTIDSDNLVDPDLIDIDETASGLNAVGQALNDFAKVDISKVIDTSTVQGKLLADKLGEGGYVDSKSTILGQMQIISDEFKDSNGNPKIPAWAQGVARNASRSIAFGGMSGTAATAAMANAIMEASLGVAEKEANFFQTLTVENLNNKQEALINKASVLANMELANLDVKSQAAIENARAFLKMDLTNLENKQQAEVLNTQIRVDALFEDAKAKNTERLYTAEATNDMNKFYDNLSAQVDMHRADSINAMNKFNVGEANDNSEFQAQLDTNRETFYKELQWNVDKAVFEWNQKIALNEFLTKFEAAKFDTQNMFDLTTEKLNRIWDREDAVFDYIWKSAETEKERMVDLYEIDKEYEVEMRKTVNDENYKKGQADWELFKWGADLLGMDDDFDLWDIV